MARSNTSIVDDVGDTVIMSFEWPTTLPVGATWRMQWRVRPESTDVAETLASSTAGNTVSFTMTAAESRALGAGTWYWDAEYEVSSQVFTFARGTAQLRQDVTRT